MAFRRILGEEMGRRKQADCRQAEGLFGGKTPMSVLPCAGRGIGFKPSPSRSSAEPAVACDGRADRLWRCRRPRPGATGGRVARQRQHVDPRALTDGAHVLIERQAEKPTQAILD